MPDREKSSPRFSRALSTPRAAPVYFGGMYVTVQKSIRHKSSRMYHGVYSGRRRRRRSENNELERERESGGGQSERASEETSKAFISVAVFYFFARSFVRSTIFSTLGAFSTLHYRVSERGLVEVIQLVVITCSHGFRLRVKGRRRFS